MFFLFRFSHSAFVSLFVSEVIAAYDDAVSDKAELVTQNISLQFIFDLKFVNNMLLLPHKHEVIIFLLLILYIRSLYDYRIVKAAASLWGRF